MQGLAKVFYEGPDSKCFWLCISCGLSQLVNSTVVAPRQSSHRNKWVWLCSNNTFVTKTDGGLDLACGLQFANAWIDTVFLMFIHVVACISSPFFLLLRIIYEFVTEVIV